ncbi:MAG: hypothetical protein JXR81_06355 [Candidatus Goldbacteria bacterium]|nr:hypothetical protein [Candidatus Goldiibacteriota bacterium]
MKNRSLLFLIFIAAVFSFLPSCALFEFRSGYDTAAEEAVLETQNLPTGDNSGYQPAVSTAAEDEIVSWEDIDAAEAQKEIESADIQGASEEGFDKTVLEPAPAAVTAPKELEEEEESKK